MKKILYSILALAVSAIVFTSCSDVPEPYDNPNNKKEETTPDIKEGTGTEADPYNVIAALEKIKTLKGGENTGEIFVKGKVVSVKEIDTDKFGNASYYISVDGTDKNQLLIYRSKALGNQKFTSKDAIKAGDEVVVKGSFVNFQGKTPESEANKSYLYSLNGKKENSGGTTPYVPEGDGTVTKPYTVKDLLSIEKTGHAYVKGFIVGYVYGREISGARFSSDTCTVKTNILIAADATETDKSKCATIQLPIGAVRNGINLADHKATLKSEVLLYGSLDTYLGVKGLKAVSYAKMGTKGYGVDPQALANAILSETFAESKGAFTIENETPLPAALSHVWAFDTRYKHMKATASVKKVNYATDAWLISPAIDLSQVTTATLSFEQAGKFFGTMKDEILIKISENYTSGKPSTATWVTLTPDTYPTNTDFTFVKSTVDLTAYAGKKNLRIAFQYISSTTKAGMWELKNLLVK